MSYSLLLLDSVQYKAINLCETILYWYIKLTSITSTFIRVTGPTSDKLKSKRHNVWHRPRMGMVVMFVEFFLVSSVIAYSKMVTLSTRVMEDLCYAFYDEWLASACH